MEDSDNQKITDKPWLWKKGQSGNLAGRPKGFSLKEWTRERLAAMTDDERDAFLEGIPKEIVWKMTEGNPENKTDLTTLGERLPPQIIVYGDTDPLKKQLDGSNTP